MKTTLPLPLPLSLLLFIFFPTWVNAQYERLELQKEKTQPLPVSPMEIQLDTLDGLGQTPPLLDFSVPFQAELDMLEAMKKELDEMINKKKDTELKAKVDSLMERVRFLEEAEFKRKMIEVHTVKDTLNSNYKRFIITQTRLEDQNGNPMASPDIDKLYSDTSLLNMLRGIYLKKEMQEAIRLNAVGDSLSKCIQRIANEIYLSEKEQQLSPKLENLLKESNRLVKEAEELIHSINESRQQAKNELERRKSTLKNEEQQQDSVPKAKLDGLMSTIVPLTDAIVVPSVNIRASRRMDTRYSANRSSSFNAFIFLAPTSFGNTDTSFAAVTQKAKNSVLIPELSDFGFKCSYSIVQKQNKGFVPKGFGLTLSGYYLNKNVPIGDAESGIKGQSNVGYCHLVEGLGINFWDGIFEAYANYNQIIPLHGVKTYENFFGVNSDVKAYVDMGVSALLSLGEEDSQTYLLTRFGFIVNHGGINPFIRENDKALAMISISLKPGF